MLGFKMVYLEAGSGAQRSVPDQLIQSIRQNITIPLIVGGGICNPDEARRKVIAGASIIVIGNHFQNKEKVKTIAKFCKAVQDV